jgi:hypothetical protein
MFSGVLTVAVGGEGGSERSGGTSGHSEEILDANSGT